VSGFLLDTNVLSELVRPRPEPKVIAWVDATDEDLMYLSVLTLGEIRKGVAALRQGRRRTPLEAWLESSLVVRFANRILPIDRGVADRWGSIAGEAAARRSPIAVIDGLLAATALHHNLTLVSRDVRGVQAAGVRVFNPWTG